MAVSLRASAVEPTIGTWLLPVCNRRYSFSRHTPRRLAGRLAMAGVIMDAATTLFLRNGFLGTSVDDIAALAHVSKQTVYTHFADKEHFFAGLIRGDIARVDEFIEALAAMPVDRVDLDQHRRDHTRRHIRAVIQPRALQLRRLVIGESGRFPALARTCYERVHNTSSASGEPSLAPE